MHDKARMLTTLMANLPGMVYRCCHDENWTMEFVSDGAQDLLGYTPAEILSDDGPQMTELIHPHDLPAVSLGVEDALSQRQPFRLVYRLRHRTGSYKTVWEQGRGIYNEADELLALEGFITDISARVQAEQSLRQAQKMDALGQMAGGLAHDFNNLLTVITAAADGLRIRTAEEHLPYIDDIQEASSRATTLIRQLLAFSRRHELELSAVDLVALLDDMHMLLDRLLDDHHTLVMRVPQATHFVLGHRSSLEQVVLNLCVNARDAMADGGKITVTVSCVEPNRDDSPDPALEWIVLEVADQGPGIDPEIADRIFDPFVSSKGPRHGTGLGLSVVHGIALDHDAHIEFDSNDDGTTFRVWFRRVNGESNARVASAATPRVETREGTILLVDDHEQVRSTLARVLRTAGYTVLIAPTGAEALRVSKRHKGPIHALVTDLRMPEMSGLELIEALRAERPQTRSLLVTATEIELDETPVLLKPFTGDDLVAAVQDLLRE